MRVFILTFGSRGDVQPYVALGKGLQAAGHAVTVCTSASFEPFIAAHGLAYGYMSDDLLKLIDTDAGREAMENSTGVVGWAKTAVSLAQQVKPLQHQMLHDSWHAAQAAQPDLIIYHPKAFGGAHIAEKLGIPAMLAIPLPVFVPTGEFPNIVFPNWKLGSGYNRLTYTLALKGARAQYGKLVQAFRQETLGLLPQPRTADELHFTNGDPIPVLHGYSRHVAPHPADWPSHVHTTGYWFLDQATDWQPPADLQAFLDAGEPPVYVGFGSMAGRNPAKVTQIVVAALQKAGVRGLIATGWGGLDASDLPETIFRIEQAPHDWLFERITAVIHHGGAGTTAAGLRAGKPTVICPFFGDQPFWGQRVAALGA
ncbi:MAG: glycosyltransferase family 1 protein, partial [Anaerolineales bacterium]|nr:glycosyltransferase family 1 protein [Anaerolineales bacterium]